MIYNLNVYLKKAMMGTSNLDFLPQKVAGG